MKQSDRSTINLSPDPQTAMPAGTLPRLGKDDDARGAKTAWKPRPPRIHTDEPYWPIMGLEPQDPQQPHSIAQTTVHSRARAEGNRKRHDL
jgi:hypothetical protein